MAARYGNFTAKTVEGPVRREVLGVELLGETPEAMTANLGAYEGDYLRGFYFGFNSAYEGTPLPLAILTCPYPYDT